MLLCDATGQHPLQYQWFKERQTLVGATQQEFQIIKLEKNNEGYYICRVSNGYGYEFTQWARVDVITEEPEPSPPEISMYNVQIRAVSNLIKLYSIISIDIYLYAEN